MADAVITFVLEVVYSAILFCKTIDDVSAPVLGPAPADSFPYQDPQQVFHPQPSSLGHITASPYNAQSANNLNLPYLDVNLN